MEIMGDWKMNQINANAPTPGEIMELAKENERLKGVIEAMESSRQKFAIEQQIKALEEFKKECGMFVPVHKLKGRIEQLRKEIEK